MLLQTNFHADNNIVKEALSGTKKYKKYSKYINGEKWIEKDGKIISGLSEFAIALKDVGVGDLIDTSFTTIDEDEIVGNLAKKMEVDFKFDNILKKVYIMHLSMIWSYTDGLTNSINALIAIEPFEERFNKPFGEFTEDEIKATVTGLYEPGQIFGLQFKVKVYTEFVNFYSSYYNKRLWRDMYGAKNFIQEITGESEEVHLITFDNLLDLFETQDNNQEYIIPILIFSGVRYSSKEDEDDEILRLSIKDIGNDYIDIKNGSSKRRINVDPMVCQLVKDSYRQKAISRVYKNNMILLELVDTEYILRPAQKSVKRDGRDRDVMSFRGAYNRLLNFQETFEITYGVKNVGVRLLENCGKTSMINRFIDEGLGVQDAIRATLKHFGDWEVVENNPTSEAGLQSNRTRVIRLKRIWEAYKDARDYEVLSE